MSRLSTYKKTKDDRVRLQESDMYLSNAESMWDNFLRSTEAMLDESNDAIVVACGCQYYGMRQRLAEIIADHTAGQLTVMIDHHDSWDGDDYDVSYIACKCTTSNKKDVRRAFNILKKFNKKLKMTVCFYQEWK